MEKIRKMRLSLSTTSKHRSEDNDMISSNRIHFIGGALNSARTITANSPKTNLRRCYTKLSFSKDNTSPVPLSVMYENLKQSSESLHPSYKESSLSLMNSLQNDDELSSIQQLPITLPEPQSKKPPDFRLTCLKMLEEVKGLKTEEKQLTERFTILKTLDEQKEKCSHFLKVLAPEVQNLRDKVEHKRKSCRTVTTYEAVIMGRVKMAKKTQTELKEKLNELTVKRKLSERASRKLVEIKDKYEHCKKEIDKIHKELALEKVRFLAEEEKKYNEIAIRLFIKELECMPGKGEKAGDSEIEILFDKISHLSQKLGISDSNLLTD